jgi:hypothetical protein
LLEALFFLFFLRRSRDGYFDGVDDGVWRLERIRAGGAGSFFWLTRGCGASDE